MKDYWIMKFAACRCWSVYDELNHDDRLEALPNSVFPFFTGLGVAIL